MAKNPNQIKADKVRRKVPGLVKSMSDLQSMTTYSSEKQRKGPHKLPSSSYVVMCKDEMVPKPHEVNDGIYHRDQPHWNFLVPPFMDIKELGAELVKIGKLLMKDGKKDGMKDGTCYTVTQDPIAFEKSIYGNHYVEKSSQSKNKKRKNLAGTTHHNDIKIAGINDNDESAMTMAFL
jgi:hypothetical protein